MPNDHLFSIYDIRFTRRSGIFNPLVNRISARILQKHDKPRRQNLQNGDGMDEGPATRPSFAPIGGEGARRADEGASEASNLGKI